MPFILGTRPYKRVFSYHILKNHEKLEKKIQKILRIKNLAFGYDEIG